MCGLARDPGAFFTFILIIVTAYLVMTVFFRYALPSNILAESS